MVAAPTLIYSVPRGPAKSCPFRPAARVASRVAKDLPDGHFSPATQKGLLERMNRVRVRHLHPKGPLKPRTLARDSLGMVLMLHEFLEGTFSLFRDYTIENGRFVPKPLE